jgi:anti-sigma-K factor RskA
VNIKEYILSGIIESYVLGLASPEERAEFERLCKQHPELVDARDRFELALEQQLLQKSVSPAGDVKEKVMDAIRQQPSVNQTKIITMESTHSTRSSSSARWIAAASIILLLGAAFFAYKYYSESKELKTSNEELQARAKSSDSLQNLLNDIAEEQRIMKDPNVAVVNMVGTTQAPASSASIYWDSTSSSVYLVVKNMPTLPSDKQYQLWALLDNKPKSLGLFDIKGSDNKKIFLKMENVQKADAFAITIENRGNTGGPNLEQLQNMGKPQL